MNIILPYLFIFILLFFTSIQINGRSFSKSINVYSSCLFIYFVITVFIGLRGCLDTDWNQYYETYNKIGNNSFREFLDLSKYEFLFGLLAYICGSISSNYFFFQFICFLIDIILFIEFIKKFEPRIIGLSFLLFFLFEGVTIECDLLRNSKSIMLFLFSLNYLKKDVKIYLILNLIGIGFHFSSLIYILITPLFILNPNKKIIISLFFIGLLIFFFRIKISSNILAFLLTKITGGRAFEKALFYISSNKYSSEIGFSIGFIERFMTFILVLFFQEKILKHNENCKYFLILFYLYNFVYLYCWDVYIFILRFSKLFIVSYWVVIPMVYITISRKENKYLFLSILLIYAVLRISVDYKNQTLWIYNNSLINLPDLQIQSMKVKDFIRKTNALFD